MSITENQDLPSEDIPEDAPKEEYNSPGATNMGATNMDATKWEDVGGDDFDSAIGVKSVEPEPVNDSDDPISAGVRDYDNWIESIQTFISARSPKQLHYDLMKIDSMATNRKSSELIRTVREMLYKEYMKKTINDPRFH